MATAEEIRLYNQVAETAQTIGFRTEKGNPPKVFAEGEAVTAREIKQRESRLRAWIKAKEDEDAIEAEVVDAPTEEVNADVVADAPTQYVPEPVEA